METTDTSGAAYARGWSAGWAAAMAAIRDESMARMFEPPRPEPRVHNETTPV